MCRNHGPMSSLFWTIRRDEECNPAGRVLGTLGLAEDAVSVTAAPVDSLPVYLHVAKARFEEDLLDLGDGPQAPIIRECALDSAPIAKFEVNVDASEVVDRVVVVELPEVREPAVARALSERLLRLPAPEDVTDEQATRGE